MSEFIKFSNEEIKKYKKSGYRLLGKFKHSAIEICRWTKSRLRGKRNCYKIAYGIASHRCIQITPTLDFCNLSCSHCWRTFGNQRFKAQRNWDSPKDIIDDAIKQQRLLLSGFGGNDATKPEILKEAMEPKHFAISLDGEPTLYPYIAELVKEITSRGATAFLVTNGTMPHKLKELLEKNAISTNLYISVYGTNEKMFYEITNKRIPGLWNKVVESLKLFPAFSARDCRTVFRITSVRELTLRDPEGYARLIKLSQPLFVELKGFTLIGESRQRLTFDHVPTMQEIEDFANKISKLTGYIVKFKDKFSRVVILVKDEDAWNWNIKKIRKNNNFS